METQDKLYYYHNDINGAPLRLTDEAGNIVWNVHYDIFGKIDKLKINEVHNPIRMQGQYEDEETGLYYNRYRYYDPNISAYVSQDPLGLGAGENVYSYVKNSFGWIDPLGLNCEKLKEYDVAEYGEFNKPQHAKDGLSGHELLQNSWLEANGKIPKRGVGLSRKNPAIALKENPQHQFITAQQKKLNMNKANLQGVSWRKNVQDNIELLKQAGVPREKIAELAKQTRDFALKNNF